MNILFLILLGIFGVTSANASILVILPSGKYTTKSTLSEAATSEDTANKTIVVTSALSAVQSNISSATLHEWPANRKLEVRKNGLISPTTTFRIARGKTNYVSPEWFGVNNIPGVTNMTKAWQKTVSAGSLGVPIKATGTYSLAYNAIELTSDATINGAGTGKIINTNDTHGKLFFYANGKSRIRITGMTFTTPSSYQAAMQFLNCRNVDITNNNAYNCGLVEFGSSAQKPYLLGGYYDGSAKGIYAATDGSMQSSYINITGNRLTGDSIVTTLADPRRSGITLAYTRIAAISNNTVKGYIHGIMFWGGDAAPTINGASGNMRKAGPMVINKNTVSGITAGGDIWGSMGDSISVTGNTLGYAGDVGIDFEGCTNSQASDNMIYNRTNGAMALGFINNNISFSGNTAITDTNGVYIVHLFGIGSYDNTNLNFTGNTIIAKGDVKALIATASTQFSSLTFSNNNLENVTFNLIATNRNLTVENNKMNFTWDVNPAFASIATNGFTDSGVNKTKIHGNIVTSAVKLTANNSGFYSNIGGSFGIDNTTLEISDNDFSILNNGWMIFAKDSHENAANLQINIVRNKIGGSPPSLKFDAAGKAKVYQKDNYFVK